MTLTWLCLDDENILLKAKNIDEWRFLWKCFWIQLVTLATENVTSYTVYDLFHFWLVKRKHSIQMRKLWIDEFFYFFYFFKFLFCLNKWKFSSKIEH